MRPLSPRQLEIACLVAGSCTDKEIMGRLGISYYALRSQMANIARKLGLDRTKNLRVQIAHRMAA